MRKEFYGPCPYPRTERQQATEDAATLLNLAWMESFRLRLEDWRGYVIADSWITRTLRRLT